MHSQNLPWRSISCILWDAIQHSKLPNVSQFSQKVAVWILSLIFCLKPASPFHSQSLHTQVLKTDGSRASLLPLRRCSFAHFPWKNLKKHMEAIGGGAQLLFHVPIYFCDVFLDVYEPTWTSGWLHRHTPREHWLSRRSYLEAREVLRRRPLSMKDNSSYW